MTQRRNICGVTLRATTSRYNNLMNSVQSNQKSPNVTDKEKSECLKNMFRPKLKQSGDKWENELKKFNMVKKNQQLMLQPQNSEPMLAKNYIQNSALFDFHVKLTST